MRALGRGSFTIALTLVWALAWGCDDPKDPAPCHGVCGPGTRCEQGLCVVDAEPEKDASEPVAAHKPRRRTRRGQDGADAAEPDYVPVDDAKIPRYDPTKTQVLDPNAGSERLDDTVVRSHLKRLEPGFDRCIAEAAAAGVPIGSGRVEFELGIEANGRVSGVNAKAPAAIESSGVVSCLRKVLFDHRFPAFDGPSMGVEYRFEIG